MSDKRQDSNQFRDALEQRVRSAEDEHKSGERSETRAPAAAEERPSGKKTTNLLEERITLFGPSLRDMAVFCRQLATLLDVGIPLVRSLRILADRSQHPKLRKVADQVATDVEEGQRLSEALARHPRIFPALVVNVARVGETGGILEPSLNRLADTMEQKLLIKRRIQAALAYPVVAFLVAIAALVIVLAFGVPMIVQVYESVGVEQLDLPGITKFFIGMSNIILNYWWLYIPLLVLLLIGWWIFGKTRPGRNVYDWIGMHSPVFGMINHKIAIARSTRNLGNLLSAGIPLLETLGIVSRTSESYIVRNDLERVRDNVERGGKMEEPLRKSKTYPDLVVDMIAIGDEAGALDTMLLKIADMYDEEVDANLKGLSALLEPLMILALGLVVIAILLAFFVPYFNMVNAMRVT